MGMNIRNSLITFQTYIWELEPGLAGQGMSPVSFISVAVEEIKYPLGGTTLCIRLGFCIKLRAKEGRRENNAIMMATE